MKNRSGFTMSEILITLGVIGVIAAMTLPSVIKSYQKKVTVNRLKETYSTLSQAFQRAVVEHGEPINWTYGNNDYDLFIKNYLAPYVKIVKKIPASKGEKHYFLSNSIFTTYNSYSSHYYLLNGTEITIYPYSNTVYLILIDINGKKFPNKLGKDTFQMQFSKTSNSLSISKTFTFNGIYNDLNSLKSSCKNSGNGIFCGAWIMREGWKIPDDYPW